MLWFGRNVRKPRKRWRVQSPCDWQLSVSWQNGNPVGSVAGGAASEPRASGNLPRDTERAEARLMKCKSCRLRGFLGPTSPQICTSEWLQLRAGNRPKVHLELGTPWNQVWKIFWKLIFLVVVECTLNSFSISVPNTIWKWSDKDNQTYTSMFIFYLH